MTIRSWFERIALGGWPAMAGLFVGLAIGGIWTLMEPNRYRAETRLLVRGPDPKSFLPAVETLAESSLVAQNVAQTLRLSRPLLVTANRGEGGIFTLSVQAGSRERARQIDAEVAVVLVQKIADRFGQTHVGATILDPAHAVEQTSPKPARNLLLSGLLGLGLGLALLLARERRRIAPALADSPASGSDHRLGVRLDAVAKRERALARRAGELAEAEQELRRREETLADQVHDVGRGGRALEERERKVEQSERTLQERELELARERELIAAQAPPADAPAVGLSPAPDHRRETPVVPPPTREPERMPRLDVLERLVAEHGAEFPDQAVDWHSYLFFLREHADADGRLPAQFGGLVWEVFAPLLD